jgi:hypothetical protein
MINQVISLKYMLTGYGVLFFVLLVYIISLVIRWKKLRRELTYLNNLKKPQD